MQKDVQVKVIPKAKISGVFKENEILKVKVHAPAEKGKANREAISLLAQYFDVPNSSVILIEGELSQNKLFRIISS